MAKLKAIPKNFEQAREVLGTKSSVRLGNNTYLERHLTGIVVRLHRTNIVHFSENGAVRLYTGGYRRVTTKERINQFITGVIFQKNWQWFYAPRGEDGRVQFEHPVIFSEGIAI